MKANWQTPIIVALAMLIEYVDSTVIMTSLPAIAFDFNVDSIDLKLAVNAYFIGMGMFLPLSGWMADRFGAVNIFRCAIVSFIAGALLCSVSESLPSFVAARFLQGISGAMLVPVGRIIVFHSVPKSGYIKAFNLLTMSALLGPMIGPALGGYITTHFHWHWIFLINLPLAILLLLATRLFGRPMPAGVSCLDWKGFIYTSSGLLLVASGVSLLDGKQLDWVAAFILLVTGLLCFYRYWQHFCRRRQHQLPTLLDLSLLRVSTFRVSTLGGALFRIGVAGGWFLLPLMLQQGVGFSAAEAGSITCASAVGAIAMKMFSLRILQSIGYRQILIVNTLISSVAMCAIGLPTSETPVIIIIMILLFYGFISSLHFTSLGSMAYADIDKNKVAQATSLISCIQLLASVVGVTIAAITTQITQPLQSTSTLGSGGFGAAICVMSLFMLFSVFYICTLNKNAGANLLAS